jgi:hypothetical protein
MKARKEKNDVLDGLLVARNQEGLAGVEKVHQAGTQGATAGKLVEMTSVKERVYCRKCGSDRVYRTHRSGFFEEKVYPILGFYPWRCTVCGDQKMLHKRRMLKIKDKDYVD